MKRCRRRRGQVSAKSSVLARRFPTDRTTAARHHHTTHTLLQPTLSSRPAAHKWSTVAARHRRNETASSDEISSVLRGSMPRGNTPRLRLARTSPVRWPATSAAACLLLAGLAARYAACFRTRAMTSSSGLAWLAGGTNGVVYSYGGRHRSSGDRPARRENSVCPACANLSNGVALNARKKMDRALLPDDGGIKGRRMTR